LQVFGGVVPSALRPTIEGLLKMSGLPEDMRASLTAIGGDPSWQTMQTRAEDLGIKLSDLGPKFSQARISDIALSARDRMFATRVRCGARTRHVGRVVDDVSGRWETGAALPDTLKPHGDPRRTRTS
jgi:hypothetical protein